MKQKKAVVLVSGGLDSATVLAIAINQGFDCHCIAFDYGQRHRSELDASHRISDALKAAAHKFVKLDLKTIGGSALTDDNIAVPESEPEQSEDTSLPENERLGAALDVPIANSSEIPITYVPARNTIFLSIALGWAEVLSATDIFIGVNAVDYSGYPDCRPEYIAAFEAMANLATRASVEGERFTIHTPLISMTKEDIIKQGVTLGIDYGLTVSCYQATASGLACGRCESCRIRKQGFLAAGIVDPTPYI